MDTYTICGISGVCIIGLACYKGLICVPEYIKNKYNQTKTIIGLMRKLSVKSNEKPSIDIYDEGRAFINYEYCNNTYKIMIPFNRSYVAKMCEFQVYLIDEHGKEINITQQPGIPYLNSAEDLGGKLIRITNEGTGAFHYYDESPMYGVEVIDDE